jgi:serine phosphatase RsbU (regulator of sigma subunit)
MPLFAGVVFFALAAVTLEAAAPSDAPLVKQSAVLAIEALGKGAAPLDGPWQFHLGDDPAWAVPQTADTTGTGGWEQIGADQSWGAQGHRSYTGYAWYRKHLSLSPAIGASPDFYLFIRRIDDVYAVYWNGQLVGHLGEFPSQPSYPFSRLGEIVRLGPARDGVLAIRVWKAPLASSDSGLEGGFLAIPLVGSLHAVTAEKTALDYSWLRGRQYYFALQSLYGLVMILSLLAWLRNRSQHVLLAMAAFGGSPVIGMFLVGLRLPFSFNFAMGWLQPTFSVQDIGLWYLLLYLLDLAGNQRLARLTRTLAIISIVCTSLDGMLILIDWSRPEFTLVAQWADAILTAIFTILELYPLVLIAFALRKRLDLSRWLLAVAAFLSGMLSVVRIGLLQGSRFTHWTIGDKLNSPWFLINGNGFTPQTVANTLLLVAIIYAVFRYMQETLRHQGALEQELKSARELQQILIPETLPELAGFSLTSAYRPAQEVGGDFFQIIPLEGESAGSTLILLGDVSGKGLKAAMTVSLIVGAARTAARFAPGPADVLAELNTRLHGRMQGGFTTCLAMRLSPEGECTMASAGHPGPFLNQHRLELPGALPLGVLANPGYKEETITLREGDNFSLYTDGLLEARNPSGEIFSFERLDALFSARPNAAEATEAAVNFGQDDDITVLTLTRLASGEQSTTRLITPSFAPA